MSSLQSACKTQDNEGGISDYSVPWTIALRSNTIYELAPISEPIP